MAGTSSKKRKHPGPKKQPSRGNPQKARQSGDPRTVEPATARDWIGAARLRTLPLAISPVVVGTAAAILVVDVFHWVIALFCLIVSVSLQIGVNYANDYSDGIRGTDDHRVGPARLTASRKAKPRAVLTVALVFFMHVPLAVLHQNLFGSLNASSLLAIPFFIYAGELMGRGSVAQRLVDFVHAGVGSVRGSLGVTTVGVSAIFGAISGVSAAAVATIGRVMVPAMLRAGYPEAFSAGLVTAVGAIDIIIPPSIPMIVYGAAAEQSVPRLYAAGVLPGLLIAGMVALYVVWRARREGFGRGEPFVPPPFERGHGLAALGLERGEPGRVLLLDGVLGGGHLLGERLAVGGALGLELGERGVALGGE